MNIRFTGKNLSVTEGIKEHLRERITKFEKYGRRLIESHVILKKEKYLFIAEVTLLAKNLKAYGEGVSKENIFAAIDQSAMRVEKQLKKFREKVKDHHKNTMEKNKRPSLRKSISMPAPVQIIPTPSLFVSKPMSLEEASLQLDLSAAPLLAFQDSRNLKVNVLYKREDGSQGLIEPVY